MLAFLMSAIMWGYQWYQHRVRIDINVIDYMKIGNVVQFFVFIHNRSERVCPVYSIQLLSRSFITCELESKPIKERNNHLITTASFPINLSPLESRSVYLEFVDCPDIQLAPGKEVTFQIHTMRGPVSKIVLLGDISHYLHTRMSR